MTTPQWYDHVSSPWRIDGETRVGKKAAGRMLDGRTWDELPKGGAE